MMYDNNSGTCIKLNTGKGLSVAGINGSAVEFLVEENSEYHQLPKEYFKHEGIPPPLVRRNWFNTVHDEGKTSVTIESVERISEIDDENSTEDLIPLSDLKLQLPVSSKEICNSTRDLQSDSGKSQGLVIQRKRGRPKKQTQSPASNSVDNSGTDNFAVDVFRDDESQDNCDNWWNKSAEFHEESAFEVNEENNSDQTWNTEHYVNNFLQVPEENTETKNKVHKSKRKSVKCDIVGIETSDSKLTFPCPECAKSFSAASTLKYHLRIHNGTLIKCTQCDRGFTTNYLLKCHMRIHNGDLFMCHKCGRGFTTAELLKVHSRCHTGIRPYKCEVCKKSFQSSSNLRQHKETHQFDKRYLCFQCGSSFSQKRCLDFHMLSHGEKNHICTVCGKLWARKYDLEEHMRVHTGYKPYACSNCPRKFTQSSSLRRHQLVHMEAIPVQCLTCGKLLKCDSYYKRHMKKHMKEMELTNN